MTFKPHSHKASQWRKGPQRSANLVPARSICRSSSGIARPVASPSHSLSPSSSAWISFQRSGSARRSTNHRVMRPMGPSSRQCASRHSAISGCTRKTSRGLAPDGMGSHSSSESRQAATARRLKTYSSSPHMAAPRLWPNPARGACPRLANAPASAALSLGAQHLAQSVKTGFECRTDGPLGLVAAQDVVGRDRMLDIETLVLSICLKLATVIPGCRRWPAAT